jgi:hypothetical protein
VDADTDCAGFHVAFSDHEHGVDFHLLGALDFAVDLVGAFIDFRYCRKSCKSAYSDAEDRPRRGPSNNCGSQPNWAAADRSHR